MVKNEDSTPLEVEIMKYCPKNAKSCERLEEIKTDFDINQVFLNIPYSPKYRKYEEAIRKTLIQYGLKPLLAEAEADYEDLLCNVCKKIQKSGYAIVDISWYKPSVLYELGLIQSLGKKCCILRNSDTKLPPDLGGLTIPPYENEEGVEKIISKWIAKNVEEISIKIAQMKEIYNVIFFELERDEILELGMRILEIMKIGPFNLLPSKHNQLIEKLIELLKHGDDLDKTILIEELAEVGDDRAIEPLVGALKDKDHNVRWRVAEALGAIGNSKAVDTLIKTLRDESYDVRSKSAEALWKIGDKRAVEPLIMAMKDMNSQVRSKVATALGIIGDNRAVEPLIKALKDRDQNVKLKAIIALSLIRDDRAIEPLIPLLFDKTSDVQKEVRNALIKIGEPAVESIIKFAENYNNHNIENFSLRSNYSLLGKIGSPKAIPFLEKELNRAEELNQSIIIEALGEIKHPNAINILIKFLDKDSPLRTDAIAALGNIGLEEAVKYIHPILKEEDDYMFQITLQALDEIGSKESFEPLWEAFKKYGSSHKGTRVADVLIKIDREEMENRFLSLLKSDNVYLKEAAARNIYKVSTKKSEKVLINLLEDEELHYLAVGALQNIYKKEIPQDMFKLLDSENDLLKESAAEIIGFNLKESGIKYVAKLRNDKSECVKKTIIDIFSYVRTRECVEYLIEMLENNSQEIQLRILYALNGIGYDSIDPQTVLPKLRKIQQNAKKDMKEELVWAYGHIATQECMDYLFEFLEDEDIEVRNRSLELIEHIFETNIIPSLQGHNLGPNQSMDSINNIESFVNKMNKYIEDKYGPEFKNSVTARDIKWQCKKILELIQNIKEISQ